MRIVNLTRNTEGAYGAFVDLHLVLRQRGIDSRVLCTGAANGTSGITEVDLKANINERRFFHYLKKTADFIGLSHVPDLTSSRFSKTLKKLEYDILHICTARGTASYLNFPSLTRRVPAIFTITSMWSFTGHCFHSLDCDRWKVGCGKCPKLSIEPPVKRDATRFEWKLKDRAYRNSNLTVVTTSKWLTRQVQQSMLNQFSIHEIPHGIDTKIYQPLDQDRCRHNLAIPPNKKILMFASDRMGDYLKGGDLLIKALNGLPKSLKSDIVLLLMGHGGENISKSVGMQAVNLGYLSEHHRKAICYSAADLFIFPTRAETFGLVSIESQACGTPVVSFEIGGVTDHVRPGITGYLAKPDNVEDFRNGIIQLIEDKDLRNNMSQQCRTIAVKEYDIELWAERFIDLCRTVGRPENVC